MCVYETANPTAVSSSLTALEMLSKLCQLEKNEAILSECLEGETYSRIVQLLTVHDIQLIVHTLEALYQLSELGDTTTNMIANVKNAVGQCPWLAFFFYFYYHRIMLLERETLGV